MSRRRGQAWKHRPYHRAFYALPAPARERALEGFRRNEATTAIAAAIQATHAASIPVSSLNRYREWWETAERPVLEAAQKAEELLAAFKDHPSTELESVIRQLLMAQRLTAMTADRSPDPIELGQLDVRERRLRLQERALALKERELERKINTAAGNVERELRKKKELDPATIARIKQEVYGIAS